MSKRLLGKLTYANVIATLALFLALGGVSYAAGKLPKNSVGTPQIKVNAVTAPKLANGAVIDTKVANGAIGRLKITNGAVNANKLANGSVGSTKITNGSVLVKDLAGVDVTGTLNLAATPAHSCNFLNLTVPGAKVGQFPMLAFVGNVALPADLIVTPIKVSGPGAVRAKDCNVSNTTVAAKSGVGVRVITLSK